MNIPINLIRYLFIFLLITYCLPIASVEARYYNPKEGRFLQRDPQSPGQVRVQQSTAVVMDPSPQVKPHRLHPYMYTRNNPINFTDPYGLLERGTGEWRHVKREAEKQLRGQRKKAMKQNLQCPVVSGMTEEESMMTVAEAVADEATLAEYGKFGFGLLDKNNQDKIYQRMRQKYPDWPWTGWDEMLEEIES